MNSYSKVYFFIYKLQAPGKITSSQKHSTSKDRIQLYEAILGERSFQKIQKQKQIPKVKSERKTKNKSTSPIILKNQDPMKKIYGNDHEIIMKMKQILQTVQNCAHCEEKVREIIMKPMDVIKRLDRVLYEAKRNEKQLQRKSVSPSIPFFLKDIQQSKEIKQVVGQQTEDYTNGLFKMVEECKKKMEEMEKELKFWREQREKNEQESSVVRCLTVKRNMKGFIFV